MGREVRRVAIDFNWPLHKVWKGFINNRPGPTDCAACGGSGSSPTARILKDRWYGYAPFEPEDNGSVPLTIDHPAVRKFATKNTLQSHLSMIHGFDKGIELYWAMVRNGEDAEFIKGRPFFEYEIQREAARLIGMWNGQWSHHLNAEDVKVLLDAGRLSDFTRYPRTEEQKAEYEAVEAWNQAQRERKADGPRQWKTFHNGHVPTPQEVNEWAILSFGHDSINQWVCVKARCKKLRVSTRCKECKGNGTIWQSKAAMRFHNAWRKQDPPKGEGWQLWETVSEGSPISPVFSTPEELATYMSTPGNDTSVTKGTTFEQWMGMICVGWAPSLIGTSAGIKDGVKAVGDRYIEEHRDGA